MRKKTSVTILIFLLSSVKAFGMEIPHDFTAQKGNAKRTKYLCDTYAKSDEEKKIIAKTREGIPLSSEESQTFDKIKALLEAKRTQKQELLEKFLPFKNTEKGSKSIDLLNEYIEIFSDDLKSIDPFVDQKNPFGGGHFYNPERVRQEKEKYSFELINWEPVKKSEVIEIIPVGMGECCWIDSHADKVLYTKDISDCIAVAFKGPKMGLLRTDK